MLLSLKSRLLCKVESESVSLSVMSNSETSWTVALQAPLSMGFSRQEYGVGCLSLLEGVFLTQGVNLSLSHQESLYEATSPKKET